MTNNNYSAIKKYAASEEIKQIFRGIVGDDHAEGYVYSVIVAVSASDALKECTPQSIMRSAARAASLGLSCDPALGQAHLVPYKNEATLIPGWRGIRDMAYRTGQVAKINVGYLAEGQEWVENQLTGDAHIEGNPKNNNPVGWFAYMKTFSGREHSLYMTVDEIQKHKEKYAQGYDRARSAWNTEFHKMAKKTVLNQLLKQWAPLDPTGAVVANLDYASGAIDDMPDPEQVTVTNPLEDKTNNEILDELGFGDNSSTITTQDIIDCDATEVVEWTPPKTVGEILQQAHDGQIPGVDFDMVKVFREETDGNYNAIVAKIKHEIEKQ